MVTELRPPRGVAEQVKCARESLAEATRALIALEPDAAQVSESHLSRGVATLKRLEEIAKAQGIQKELHPDIQALRGDVRTIAALIEQAAAYYLAWGKLLSLNANGYGAAGTEAPVIPQARIVVRG